MRSFPPTRMPGGSSHQPSATPARGRPAIATFVGLSAALVPVLLYSLRGAPLEPSQLFWLALATLTLAAISVWVISTA